MQILLIYHSQGGNTERLAKACLKGVKKESQVAVYFQRAFDTTLEDILKCDGLIILTPEYFGTMSGAMKDFFDRTYYPAREKEVNLPFALVVCCENDGEGAIRDVQKIASGYRLRKSLEPIIIKEKEIAAREHEVTELGQTFAAGLVMDIF